LIEEKNEGDPSKGAVSTKARQGDNLKIEQFKAQLLLMFFLGKKNQKPVGHGRYIQGRLKLTFLCV